MLIHQVQVEASQMHREFLLRHTESAELGCHDIHALRRTESCDWAAILGEHRRHYFHIRRLHCYGMYHTDKERFAQLFRRKLAIFRWKSESRSATNKLNFAWRYIVNALVEFSVYRIFRNL